MTTPDSYPDAGPGAARLRLLAALKRLAPATSEALAAELGVTGMAVRQHLAALEADGLAAFETRAEGRGRPAKFWSALPAADGYFTDAHAALTADLLGQMARAFGEAGIDKLLSLRTKDQLASYRARMGAQKSLKAQLTALARIRTEEGYMAAVRKGEGGAWLLAENHCPVCAAARACTGLCREELTLFRAVLGDDVEIVRTDHILAGARRCVYRIAPARPEKARAK